MSPSEHGSAPVSMPQTETLLARAAALDAQERAGGVDVAELPRAAVDAGIGAAAFDAAYRDAAVPVTAASVRPPWIVRMTMIGVSNRVVAWGLLPVLAAWFQCGSPFHQAGLVSAAANRDVARALCRELLRVRALEPR